MDKLNTLAWEGRTRTVEGGVSAAAAARIHATLGDGRSPAPGAGDPLPPLWHWCAFPPSVPMAELGRDGHPMLGDFLPPLHGRRRMWAAGRLDLVAGLRVGEPLRLRSVVAAVREKQTASGEMVVVSVDHQVVCERGVAIEERQDIVYLEIPDAYRPPARRPLPDAPVLRERRRISEALLFRYSALTFNAHRIHYDLAYARQVEHYPGLVIHGPLQATFLMQAACRHRGGGRPAMFDFRAVHPMLLIPGGSTDLDIVATEDEDGALTLFSGQDGHQGMQACAIWEGTR